LSKSQNLPKAGLDILSKCLKIGKGQKKYPSPSLLSSALDYYQVPQFMQLHKPWYITERNPHCKHQKRKTAGRIHDTSGQRHNTSNEFVIFKHPV